MQLIKTKYPHGIGLIGHTIIDYPNKKDARKIIEILVANQVDLIELQIPFSEPIADGPVFAKANHTAIANGVTLDHCFDFMAEMTQLYSIPFVFMTYANILYKKGFDQFVAQAASAGAVGAIVPDLPLDIAEDYVAACHQYNFSPISVVSPNISKKRLQTLSAYFDGFIYAVARAGVTGTKTEFDQAITDYLNELRKCSSLPIAVGFGVSSVDDLLFLKGKADYAVMGTQTIRAYEQNGIAGVQSLWEQFNPDRLF